MKLHIIKVLAGNEVRVRLRRISTLVAIFSVIVLSSASLTGRSTFAGGAAFCSPFERLQPASAIDASNTAEAIRDLMSNLSRPPARRSVKEKWGKLPQSDRRPLKAVIRPAQAPR